MNRPLHICCQNLKEELNNIRNMQDDPKSCLPLTEIQKSFFPKKVLYGNERDFRNFKLPSFMFQSF